MKHFNSPWQHLELIATDAGEIDPFDPKNLPLFRGEEAFSPEVQGWQRWSKPSPEPNVDPLFQQALLSSIQSQAGILSAMTTTVGQQLCQKVSQPPLLISILRAGVPIAALLANYLAKQYQTQIPWVALSLFYGLGWDEEALKIALQRYPNRPVWFIDGWTSGGGVAKQLQLSYEQWLQAGHADFTGEQGPQLAVFCDPKGVAQIRASHQDYFIPSACFTAPETLGFSRGFRLGSGLFQVYRFPNKYLYPRYIETWLETVNQSPSTLNMGQPCDARTKAAYRIHINEVIRAVVNRNPKEILLQCTQAEATQQLQPLLYLCKLRQIPIKYQQSQLQTMNTLAAAWMQ